MTSVSVNGCCATKLDEFMPGSGCNNTGMHSISSYPNTLRSSGSSRNANNALPALLASLLFLCMAFAIHAGLIAERCPPAPPITLDGLDDWPGGVEGERGGICRLQELRKKVN